MDQEQSPKTRQSNPWQIFQQIGVAIALIASLATLIGVVLQFLQVQKEKRIVEIQIISADQLTRLPSVSGLDGEFTYNNIPVIDLWRLRLQFTNVGDTTLIGEGSASSLMAKMISISFPSDVHILDASFDADSFYSLTQLSADSLGIEFTQWRRGEKFETIIYLASDKFLESPPMPTVSGRPIINGDIYITDLTVKGKTQPRPAIDYIFPPVALVGKILGGILALAIGAISFGWFVVLSLSTYFYAQYWKLKYSASFQKHLESLGFLSEKEKRELLKKPWKSEQYGFTFESSGLQQLADGSIAAVSSSRIWKNFDGPPIFKPVFDTFLGTIGGLLLGVGLIASCAAILASMIII